MCVQGSFAYFGLANQTVAIVDCSAAPSSMVLLNVTSTMGFTPSKLMVNGPFLYACGFGLSVTNVTLIGELGTPQRKLGSVRDFAIRNNYLYAVGNAGNLSIHDISSPLSPVQVGWLNVTQSVSDLMGICVTTRGSQVLALIWATERSGLYVVDITNPATPVLLGVRMVTLGSASGNIDDVVADAERVYVANGLGICIYSKESLNSFNLSPAYHTQSLGEILVSICIVLLSLCPFWGSGFLWMRSKRVARSQSKDLWVTPGVVTRTIILFCLVIPIDMALSPLIGLDIYSFLFYDLIPIGIASAIPLLMYWRQRRLGKGGEEGLTKEQLMERLKAEKDARARAEEEVHRKSDEERKKREEEKTSKQQAKEDAKRRQAEEETRKKTEQEEMRMRKLQQIVKVSARLPIDRIAQMLEMDSEEVWKRVLDWAERFHFTIDGQDLIFNKETVNDFITSLDKEFKQWGKDGKV